MTIAKTNIASHVAVNTGTDLAGRFLPHLRLKNWQTLYPPERAVCEPRAVEHSVTRANQWLGCRVIGNGLVRRVDG